MINVLVAVLFLIAVTGCGCTAVSLFDRSQVLDRLERAVLALPCGLGAVGAVLFTLNFLGAPFTKLMVVPMLAAGAAPGLYHFIRRDLPSLRGARRAPRETSRRSGFVLIAVIVTVWVLAGFLARSLVNVNWQPDTELYHFPYASVVFRTQHQPGYASLSFNEEFSFPPALFVVYAALWSCLGHIDQLSPNLLPVPLLFCWAGLSWLAVKRVLHAGSVAGVYSMLLFVSIYALAIVVCGESCDFLPVILGGAAVYLVARDLEDRGWRRLPVVVLLLSANCWTKYHGIPYAFCVGAAILICAGWNRPALRACFWVCLGPLLSLAPLLIRNSVLYGNPIYPAAGRILGGFLVTHWMLNVAAAWWQPNHLFFAFPAPLCLLLREPAVLFGIPALWALLARRRMAEALPGIMALLFLTLFVSVLANRTPFPLRFAAPSLGILCWYGGMLIERLRAPGTHWAEMDRQLSPRGSRSSGSTGVQAPDSVPPELAGAGCLSVAARGPATTAAGLAPTSASPDGDGGSELTMPFYTWWALSAVVVVLYALFWQPGGRSGQEPGFGGSSSIMEGAARFWWVPLLLPLLALSRVASLRERVPWVFEGFCVLALSAVTIGYHQPFTGILHTYRLGVFTAPRWGIAARRNPTDGWMQSNLRNHPVIYTLFDQRWSIPGAAIPPDDPLVEVLHQPGIGVPRALERLRRLGVDYVVEWRTGTDLDSYEGVSTDTVFKHLKEHPFFDKVHYDPWLTLYRVTYPGGQVALRPRPGDPMPWLLDFAASGPMP